MGHKGGAAKGKCGSVNPHARTKRRSSFYIQGNLLLNDLSVTLFKLVEVILHHVDFGNLLCYTVFHLVPLRLKLCCVVAEKVELMSDKVEQVGESR